MTTDTLLESDGFDSTEHAAVSSLERLPSRISPSRAKDFAQCPRLFYYKTILGLTTPNTFATTKGTISHLVFERLFDHPREERTVDTALAYVGPAWQSMIEPLVERDSVELTSPDARIRDEAGLWRDVVAPGTLDEERLLARARDYREIAAPGSPTETQLLTEVRAAVENYFTIERPWNFDPEGRELHLEATTLGVTLHGFIDRLDRYTTSAGEERWVISDYKTGKTPSPRFLDEAFFAMKVYAVLLLATQHVMPYSLRLVYVTADKSEAVKTMLVDQQLIDVTQRKMKALWSDIKRRARDERWDPKRSPLCPYCHFQNVCPAWNPEIDGIVAGHEAAAPVSIRRRASAGQ